MTNKKIWILALCLAVIGCAHPPIQTSPWYKQISGSVSEINKDDFRFIVSVLNADTGVTQIFQFKTDASTRYVHAAGFSDLGIQDWTVVDFIQNDKGELVAQNITVRKRAPEELPKKSEKQKHSFLE